MSDKSNEPETVARPETDIAMTLWEHIGELRRRITKAFFALIVCTVAAWSFREKALEFLVLPYKRAWVEHKLAGTPELQTLGPSDVFVGYMQLSLVVGVIAASPIIFYQLWAFVSPGLYKREKRLVVPFVFCSTTLFISGVAFAYYVAFPFAIAYFLSLLGPIGNSEMVLTQRPTLEFYLDFATRLLLAFGIVFELPLFISFLVIGGVVTPRQLLRFSRWAILLAFVIGAVVTPGPEISSQLAVSLSLIALYFLSLGIAFVLQPKRLET